MNETALESTPPIHVDAIQRQRSVGMLELPDGEMHVVRIRHTSGSYLVAGGACNAGLLPCYARRVEPGESTDDALAELVADMECLERGEYASGELLAWHGSLVI